MSKQIKTIKLVLKSKIGVAVAIMAASFVLFYYLTVLNVYQNSLSVFIQMNGFYYTFASLFLNVIIAILIGIVAALIAYRLDIKNSKYGIAGGVVAAFSSGCPTCGTLLLSFIGFPLGLMVLPLRGIELKLISIIMLLISINLISSDKKYCNLSRRKR